MWARAIIQNSSGKPNAPFTYRNKPVKFSNVCLSTSHTLVTEAGSSGSDRYLHSPVYGGCYYLSLPGIFASGTKAFMPNTHIFTLPLIPIVYHVRFRFPQLAHGFLNAEIPQADKKMYADEKISDAKYFIKTLFYLNGIILILAWISNHIPSKVR